MLNRLTRFLLMATVLAAPVAAHAAVNQIGRAAAACCIPGCPLC